MKVKKNEEDFTFPFSSHMSVTLEIVKEILKKEVEIVVFADVAFKDKIEETGAVFKDYGVTFPIDFNNLDTNLAKYGDVLVDFFHQILTLHIEFIRKESYTIIVHEFMCSWGGFTAEITKDKAISMIASYILNQKL